MARKSATKKARAKRPARKSLARARAGEAAPKKPPRAKTPRIVLIDDEIGASPKKNPGYNRDNFLRDMADAPAEWLFCDARDDFTGFFLADAALTFVAKIAKPDLFLVDLMFGEERTLGMEIATELRLQFPRTPIALLTTHSRSDVVTGEDGQIRIGDWIDARGMGLISKDAIFRQGELWREVQELLPKRRRGGVGKRDA